MDHPDHYTESFEHSQVSIGAHKTVPRGSNNATHWLRLLSLVAPLVVEELVKGSEKHWRYLLRSRSWTLT